MTEIPYVGTELEVFAYATNWKAYVRDQIRRYLTGKVLEPGAGIGAATQLLYDGTQEKWVCLEPDRENARRIPLGALTRPERCDIRIGTIRDLDHCERFDCIVYMDVLEHIEDDRGELALAADILEPHGHLVVLSPALPALYNKFDAAIGHCRRYTKRSLRAIVPKQLQEERCIYLDGLGALLSLGNRLFLQSAAPKHILFWDRCIIPVSRLADRLIGYSVGRSILAVWKKASNT
jgi:SAM-dependent methyltransferase